VRDRDQPELVFDYGDIYQLGDSSLPGILTSCPGPILVVEDGPHTYEGSLAALNFFDDYLSSGDYIVIEDGILRDLGYRAFKNGPNRAIRDFLRKNGHRYRINRDYCDFFGYNVTWNTSGYLQRL